MSDADLRARVEQLEAIEAIKKMKALYCLHCDRGYEPDALAALFTEDAVWDGGADGGRYVGRQAIRDFFSRASGRFPFAAHLVTNPIIEVDGDKAVGLWRMLMPCTLKDADGEHAAVQVSEYDDAYLRVNGRWLIQRLAVKRHRLVIDGARWQSH